MSGGTKPGAMWGGRFDEPPAELFKRFNDSLPIDWRMVQQDIAASIAWARELHAVGVLSEHECQRITEGLNDVARHAATLPGPPLASGLEDVHTWVEHELVQRLGDLGKKLHTGRSRNDLVSTDIRLWTRDCILERRRELAELRRAFLDIADRHAHDPMPAYTHLQPAQPVTIGHWALAYEAMLARDSARLLSALDRVNECPLGCGALAGTAYAIDRHRLASALGFARPSGNSLDAASDRDFALETLAVFAACAVHLSRLAEDMIIYNSAEFALVKLSDRVTTGSSLMPQKKNPDALELIRGKCGRIAGAHAQLLMLLKAQPLAYNKDNQEDKAALFDASDELSLCLRIAVLVMDTTTFDLERCRARASAGYANATELADYLVARGVPFREAHEVAGKAVRVALAAGQPLEALPLEALRAIHGAIDADVYDVLTLEATLSKRRAFAGTAPSRVDEARAAARTRLASEQA
ncbi:MAG: argininosuccinate lyase [Phycisphaeraceae bacterium]|nr:argininosuccinate lyase [Phycisphaeraceae bacterium]